MANNIKESDRVKDLNQRVILDSVARQKRAKKALESLEQDNFHKDPHANTTLQMRHSKFKETLGNRRSCKRLKAGSSKVYPRKSLAMLLEEAEKSTNILENKLNYQTVCVVPPSKFPERHFCSVCGFSSNYTCVQCGMRFCSIKCLKVHQDTRCLKWTS